ncbi:unnamed protein product [Moneuplotes crassus]|uniref:Uncharacterized protein n=1 Tax=Euplotes crassus TaxID=5936 RepID=A0AAD1XTT7_EUPCR|nr:unnamed protein product [Moneuplotes crassus]
MLTFLVCFISCGKTGRSRVADKLISGSMFCLKSRKVFSSIILASLCSILILVDSSVLLAKSLSILKFRGVPRGFAYQFLKRGLYLLSYLSSGIYLRNCSLRKTLSLPRIFHSVCRWIPSILKLG